uniref:Uncharacterized protein n=1 Tax=Anguilla anguilla TaxID=7936 RepID=A0A0E9UBM0_ANGAN
MMETKFFPGSLNVVVGNPLVLLQLLQSYTLFLSSHLHGSV